MWGFSVKQTSAGISRSNINNGAAHLKKTLSQHLQHQHIYFMSYRDCFCYQLSKSRVLKNWLAFCTFYSFLTDCWVRVDQLPMSICTKTKLVCRHVYAIKTNVQACRGLWSIASLPLGDDIYITHTPTKAWSSPRHARNNGPFKKGCTPTSPHLQPTQILPHVTDRNIFNAEV